MRVSFSPPPCPDSLLARRDPRWKLAGLLLAVLAVSLMRTLPAAVLALVLALVLAWLARLPRGWYLDQLANLAWLLGLFVLPLPLLVRGEGPMLQVGVVSLSLAGLVLGLVIAAKAVAVLTLVAVLLASAPLDATLKAARALGIPGLLVHLALLSYRYVFTLADELARLRIALRVRGFRNRARWHSYRTAGAVTGTLLVRGHERAERVAHAMRCRGFDGTFRSLTEFGTRIGDVLFFAVVFLAAGVVLGLDVLGRA
jgi:cobalt/nickel transport system permease protein